MYVLINVLVNKPLGRVDRNGKFKKGVQYYNSPKALAKAYFRLNRFQRTVIVPALLDGTNQYSVIEFTSEN